MISPLTAVAALAQPILSSLAGSAASANPTAASATIADRVSISPAARARLAGETDAAGAATASYDTDQGTQELDIDAYFTPPAGGYLGALPPLLLPTRNNIDALSQHISAAMPQFLAKHGIPSAPASVGYDNQGQIQLPADYPYAEKFKQALADEPAMAREMSTVNALTSHMMAMEKSLAFQQEYAAASTKAEIDAVVAKYGELLSGHQRPATIALHFSATGGMSLTADGKPIA